MQLAIFKAVTLYWLKRWCPNHYCVMDVAEYDVLLRNRTTIALRTAIVQYLSSIDNNTRFIVEKQDSLARIRIKSEKNFAYRHISKNALIGPGADPRVLRPLGCPGPDARRDASTAKARDESNGIAWSISLVLSRGVFAAVESFRRFIRRCPPLCAHR